MLEKLLEIDVIKEILEKAKIFTRFIYGNPNALKYLKEKTDGRGLFQQCSKIKSTQPFLTLENIVLEKKILTKMFRSPIFLADEGWEEVFDLVSDESFWKGASDVLKVAIPLVRVIQWMTGNYNKEQMGYIYETMDQAKETIKQGFKKNKPQYTRFWKVIDEIWNGVLYTPIHAAGYYLNPNIFYTGDMFIDPEVATGLLCCVVRTTRDPRVQDRVTMHIETYQNAKGAFGLGWPEDQRSNTSPAKWWLKYGGECRELQKLNFESGKVGYMGPDEIEPLDDWVVHKGPNDEALNSGGPSNFHRKVERALLSIGPTPRYADITSGSAPDALESSDLTNVVLVDIYEDYDYDFHL
ncbi:PREDICTED: uncharacterized protein LOC105952543 [Erythranthe guttata]|uniref:uncharacterized protein LOC105952543 n=1 Tax=Erythranthe guttata TaxID=4155 RepID=UPI00064D82DE|nr:PREDICTED: uncharacterized protein LOC105952543 [Erythranthe guttata]|eukprot:XP_012831560.1 PREDICTED: uncharacterized protein LOC105952543 [Erythranthe guttata]